MAPPQVEQALGQRTVADPMTLNTIVPPVVGCRRR
jgi:hypothetical protein